MLKRGVKGKCSLHSWQKSSEICDCSRAFQQVLRHFFNVKPTTYRLWHHKRNNICHQFHWKERGNYCLNLREKSLGGVEQEKSCFKNCAKLTVKHLCLLFNKVASCRAANLQKERSWSRCLPLNFTKSFRAASLKNTCERLLLSPITSFYRANYDISTILWWDINAAIRC